MASDVRPQQIHTRQIAKAKAIASPGQLKTSDLTPNPRYSYLETPVQMQGSTFQQISSPTNSTIDESPISPREEYDPRTVTGIQMQAETASERTGSPYGFPPPQQVHPAYFAPFSEDSNTQGHLHTHPADVPPSTAPAPPQTYEDVKAPGGNLEPQTSSDRKTNALSQPVFSPPPRQATQIYDPDSLGGSNRTLENHRPGQVAHPNSALDPEWKHGLCDPDATCCLSLFCPCIIYGKTQYRLSRRAQKHDPTDTLGYEAFNGSCGIMAVACGFQWALAAIQRTRIRKIYKINGSLGSDCIKSLCCCCCVLALDEREVREREHFMRKNAGPATGSYVPQGQMSYEPPPR